MSNCRQASHLALMRVTRARASMPTYFRLWLAARRKPAIISAAAASRQVPSNGLLTTMVADQGSSGSCSVAGLNRAWRLSNSNQGSGRT